MTNSQLLILLKETGYSPEELGKQIGLSGMTLRRWMKKAEQTSIPVVYVPAIRETCLRLISEGRLNPASEAVQSILASALPSGDYAAAIQNLGLDAEFGEDRTISGDRILTGLVQIGAQSKKQADVEKNCGKVFSFKDMGKDWSERISALWTIIHSDTVTLPEKFIAYGALFYLLTPIDFIPDTIPFLGLVDDFAVLGLAAAYYARHLRVRNEKISI